MLNVIMIYLTGCATNTTVISDFCLLYEPVYYSEKEDSEITRYQIDKNNAAYEKLCE